MPTWRVIAEPERVFRHVTRRDEGDAPLSPTDGRFDVLNPTRDDRWHVWKSLNIIVGWVSLSQAERGGEADPSHRRAGVHLLNRLSWTLSTSSVPISVRNNSS